MRQLLFAVLLLAVLSVGTQAASCWKSAYGRGIGKPLSYCPPPSVKGLALCYPACNDGYKGVGPLCWGQCPSGFRDDGAFCAKPRSYGRGGGSIFSCANCEQWGLLWYPRCAANYYAFGCCTCSPACPGGFGDIGLSCTKPSYGRTAGTPLKCQPEESFDAALCYTPCKSNYSGVGPVCWGKCPAGKYECGALCTDDLATCTEETKEIVQNVFNLAIKIVAAFTGSVDVLGIVQAAGNTALSLTKSVCPKPV